MELAPKVLCTQQKNDDISSEQPNWSSNLQYMLKATSLKKKKKTKKLFKETDFGKKIEVT